MYQLLLRFLYLFLLHNSTFTFAPKYFSFRKYSLIYTMSFLSIQILKELLYPFRSTHTLFPFLFITFSILNYFLICFLQFFFITRSINFFSIKIINNMCLSHSIFNFFNYRNFFRPIRSVTLCKNVFIFGYPNYITNFKFRTFTINFFTRVNICVWFYISRFHFNCTMVLIVIFINYII